MLACDHISTPAAQQMLLATGLLLGLLPVTTEAQQSDNILQARPGPEITDTTVDLQTNFEGPCLLQSTGELFCWNENPLITPTGPDYRVDFQYLNDALDDDIAEFSLGTFGSHACAIGTESGVACVDNPLYEFETTTLDDIPEPDASYIALSRLDLSGTICGIQSDNRTVCWGESSIVSAVPETALYLKQVDVNYQQACGVDLTDQLVCWGETIIENDQNQQFGDEDLSSLGTIKQVALGPYAACVLKTDDSLRCFGAMSHYTEHFQGQTFKSIDLLYTGSPSVCFETLDGTKDCISEGYINETDIGFDSVLLDNAKPRLLWAIGQIHQINDDNSFVRYYDNYGQQTGESLFPAKPAGFRREVYSDHALELFWDRATDQGDVVTGYEIYRDGELVDTTSVVTSHFVDGLDNAQNTSFSIRPLRGEVAGNAVTIGDSGPVNPSVNPPAGLRGEVYSSTALELFWDRVSGSDVQYEISRNGVVLGLSDGNSLFQSDLQSATEYLFSVRTVIGEQRSTPATISLQTRGSSNNAVSVPTPLFTGSSRYSSTAVEIFWQRPPASSPALTYELQRNGVSVKTLDGVSYFDDMASSNTVWTYTVVAIDQAGNRSLPAEIIVP
ncbi:hypothetical protein ACUNV4_23125 [Granulosicoccus sp. 3-233]|uniref:hypothetical protein n=1 Tax=Granulosicoccus sp. 3-233 TaxID=3417969 RepID=UPI003D329B4E